MNETCFLIKLQDMTLRVRKEDFGCIVFDSNDVYAEGNKTVFEVLKLMRHGLAENEIVSEIAGNYGLPAALIAKDIEELFSKFKSLGWDMERE